MRIVLRIPWAWLVWLGLAAAVAGDEAPPERPRAEVATPNPWTRGNPEGWWNKRREAIMALPGRAESQIAFVGDSITDGWDSESGGLRIWEKEFVPLGAVNLGIVCDSTQHALWRIQNGEVDGMSKLKVVVVEIGVNNKGINGHSDAEVEKGIIALCDALERRAPQVRIILMGVFPRIWGRDNSDALNRELSKLHDGKRIFFANINPKLTETEGAIADIVGHLSETGYQIWADSIRATIRNLMAPKVEFQDPIGVPPEPVTTGKRDPQTEVKRCRAATPVRNPNSPRWYLKHFNILTWGRQFERRRAELAFLGSNHTYRFPKTVWDRDVAPIKAYNLGMPKDSTEHVLWRIDNGAVDKAWSNLKLLVVEVGAGNRIVQGDKAEDIAAGIGAICARVKTNAPGAKIVLMGLFPQGPDGEQIDDVNARIAKLADGENIFYLDISNALLETPHAIGKDGTTLSEKGYEVWVEALRPMFKQFLPTRL
ncbi:MAG: GDSL-type esterase/lipase family protein [Verrucomicrobia bacterium]|nr:GDSL-type esterase/lipase family protein [Verrucomicrobiota bacterium]